MDALLLVMALGGAHFGGVGVALQHLPGALGIQPGLRRQPHQHVVRAGVVAGAEIGLEQRALQFQLAPFQRGPVQQPVRVEGVVDTAAPVHVEGEADLGAARADHFLALRQLFRRHPVFFRQMLADILAAGRHRRIQFKRLELQFRADLAIQFGKRLTQRVQADRAPRAGYVGNKIYRQLLDLLGHGGTLKSKPAAPPDAAPCQRSIGPDALRRAARSAMIGAPLSRRFS